MGEIDDADDGGQAVASSRLIVTTRAGSDPSDNSVAQGCIYVLNSSGRCVQLLTTDETDNSATAYLPAGTYTLYAVGGNDLSRFQLPSQSEVATKKVITQVSGKTLDDLLLQRVVVTLDDEETLRQTITLQRAVLCIDKIEIKHVPSEVNQVEVSLSPLYSMVNLDGTYPESPTETYKVALTRQTDGTTWQATPSQMLFPSVGNPTIKITFTTDDGTLSYAYNATENLPANHHFTVVGNYTGYNIALTGVLTTADWGEDRTIEFDFDDDLQTVYNPVAQHFCNGYYVISVNESAHTAVLMAKANLEKITSIDFSDTDALYTAINGRMADLALPANVSGQWRLPTVAEVGVFSKDTQIVTFDDNNNSRNYYCDNGDGILKWAYTHRVAEGEYTLNQGSSGFNSDIRIRPVIDISY